MSSPSVSIVSRKICASGSFVSFTFILKSPVIMMLLCLTKKVARKSVTSSRNIALVVGALSE